MTRVQEPSLDGLAPRVRKVLACMLQGESDKQIACRLAISRHTVNQYAKQIYRHFDVTTRPELLAIWVRSAWGERFTWADG